MNPLAGLRFAPVGTGAGTARAAALLRLLGAEVAAVATPESAARTPNDGVVGPSDSRSALERWAASGAMVLTGPADGPPTAAPGDQAAGLEGVALVIELLSGLGGQMVTLDGPALLGERAAPAQLSRAGTTSVGGSCRLVGAADGWVAVNLARPSDVDLLPAWFGAGLGGADPWAEVVHHVARQPAGATAARAQELGLPVAAVAWPTDSDEQYQARGQGLPATPFLLQGAGPPRPGRTIEETRVVDLSSLWAGPLATSLLAQAGCEVIKVESTRRPDGARLGTGGFFDLLNHGKRSVALDLTSDGGRAALRALCESADVVVEAARPRAIRQLGLDPEAWVSRGEAPRLWVSITGYGRTGPWANRVAFGDDAAAAGGIVALTGPPDGPPLFCSDAYADPVAGLHAAAATLAGIIGGARGVIDVALREVVNHLLTGTDGCRHETPDETTAVRAAPPRVRQAPGPGPRLGADNEVLASVVAPA